MKSKSNPFLRALSCTTLAASAITALFCGNAASAAAYTWTKDSVATQTWTTAGNWSGSSVDSGPGTNTDTLTFFADTTTSLSNGTNNITGTVPTALTMNVLTLNGKSPTTSGQTATINIASSSSTWTLDGTTPTVSLSGISSTGALNYTVAAKLALAQSDTPFTGNGSASFNFSGVISGTGKSITKTGTSALILSGVNTFDGGVKLKAGAIKINTSDAALATGTFQIGDTSGTTAVTVDSLSARSITNALSIYQDFTYTGTSTLNQGTGAITLATNGTTGTHTITVASATNGLTLGGVIGDGGSGFGLTKAGTGTLTLSGANTYTGGTTITAGVLSYLNLAAKPSTGTTAVGASGYLALGVATVPGSTYFSSADIDKLFSGTMTGDLSNVTVTTTSGVGIDTSAGDFTYATSVSGSRTKGLVKLGANALTLSGTNTYTGGTTVSAGTLNINNNSALGTGTLTINNNNTTFDNTSGVLISITNNITSTNNTIFSGTNALTTSGTYNYNHTARILTVNGSGTLTVGSLQVDSSTGLLRKQGTGTLAITGASTVNSNTGIEFGVNGGVIIMGNKGSLGGTSFSVITGGSGTLQSSTDLTGTNKITNGVTLIGTGALTLGGTNNFELGGAISNTGTLTKSGSNTVTLSGVNTYTGGTTITAGVLSYLNLAAKPSTGTTAVGASGYLALGVATVPGSTYFSSADIDNLFSGTMTGDLSNVTVTATSGVGIDTSAGDFTYATSVSGSPTIGLVKLGTNTLTLSGTNTYTGGTTVIAGVLSPTLATALPGYNTSGKVVFNGGIVSAKIGDGTATGWSTEQVDSLLTNATKSSGAIGIDTTNGDLTQWTAFTTTNLGSTLGLAKLGANTLTLDQANIYTGPTTVSNGTLAVTATSGLGASTVTTNSATMVLSGGNGTLGSLANTAGLSMINNGTLQLQANVANTSGGVSTALTGTGTTTQILTGGGGTSSTIQLRGDSNVTFFAGSNGNGFMGGVNNTPGFTLNFDVNQLTGAGGNNAFTFGSTTNGLQIGRNVQVNVTGGNSDSLVLGPIKYVTTIGTLTLNPTTANLSVAGFANNQTTGATLTLDGTSSNNFINGVIANSTGTGTPATVVNKTNTSTWTLTATNTYTGATTVSAGTLQIGNGTDAGSIASSSSITDNGALVYNVGAGTRTYSNIISGTGTLTQNSSGGTLTLTNANTYTGATTVNRGTLALGASGSLASTSVSIAAGATLDTTAKTSYTSPASLAFGVDSSGTSGQINATAKTLAISGSAVTFNVSGTLTAPAYVLATYGTISGTASFSSATAIPGYTIDYSYNSGTQIALVKITDPFTNWIDTFGLTSGQKGKALDPDNDGLNNLGEFALDGNPNSGANNGKVVTQEATVGADKVLTLTLPVRTGATFTTVGGSLQSAAVDGVIYTIQGSGDLSDWSLHVTEITPALSAGLPALSVIPGDTGSWTYRTFRSPGVIGTDAKQFLRVKTEQAP